MGLMSSKFSTEPGTTFASTGKHATGCGSAAPRGPRAMGGGRGPARLCPGATLIPPLALEGQTGRRAESCNFLGVQKAPFPRGKGTQLDGADREPTQTAHGM